METVIFLYSGDESVDFKKSLKFESFRIQSEYYFNRYGHLPAIGSMVMQDPDSEDSSKVAYVESIEYRGYATGQPVIGISLSTEDPRKTLASFN